MLVSEFPVLPGNLAIFMPTKPILGRSVAKFRDLRETKLSVEQKEFLARQCTGDLDGNVDIRFGDSGRDIKRRYKIPSSTVNRWIKNLRSPNAINHERRGRPDSLDAQGKAEYLKEVSEGKPLKGKGGKVKKVLFTHNEIVACLNKHAQASRKRRGHDVNEFNEDEYLHEDTVKKLKKVRTAFCF
jgi:transposase